MDLRLGWIPNSTILDRWLVEDFAFVARDEPLFVLMSTDNVGAAEFDWAAPCSGVIRIIVSAGMPVRTHDVVGTIEPIEDQPPCAPSVPPLLNWFLEKLTE